MAHSISMAKYKNRIFDELEFVPCCFCNKQLNRANATIEHIVPKHFAGRNKNCVHNMAISCQHCNTARQTADFQEFRKFVQGFTDKIPEGCCVKLLKNQ